jgi:hypothetical protein
MMPSSEIIARFCGRHVSATCLDHHSVTFLAQAYAFSHFLSKLAHIGIIGAIMVYLLDIATSLELLRILQMRVQEVR